MSLPSLSLTLFLGASLLAQGPTLSQPRQPLPAGLGSSLAALAGDFDGDGLQDLAHVTQDGVQILRQGQSGAFRRWGARRRPSTLARLTDAAVGQFHNGRAALDVVLAYDDGSVYVCVNDGKGLGQPVLGATLKLGGLPASQLLVGDLFPGSVTDELVVLADGQRPMVLEHLGLGPRAAYQPKLTTVGPLWWPRGVLGDFDGDGDDDLLFMPGHPSSPGRAVFLESKPVSSAVYGLELLPQANFPVVSISVAGAVAVDLGGAKTPHVVLVEHDGTVGVWDPLGSSLAFRLSKKGNVCRLPGLADLRGGDFDGDGFADLCALDQDGRLLLAVNAGGATPGILRAPLQILDTAPRRTFVSTDLEGDGDLDIYVVGEQSEDSLLLNLGRVGRPEWIDLEAQEIQVMRKKEELLGIVDVDGDKDPDLLRFSQTGVPSVLTNRAGQARFKEERGQTRVPALSPGNYTSLLVGDISGSGSEDVMVLGSPNLSNPLGLRILEHSGTQNGGFVDATRQRWKVSGVLPVEAVLHDVLGAPPLGSGTRGCADLFALDANNNRLPVLIRNKDGEYLDYQVLSQNPVEVDSTLFVALADADSLPDLWILQPNWGLRVFVQNLGGPKPFTEFIFRNIAGDTGVVGDLTGDGRTDILVADPGALGYLRLWAGSVGTPPRLAFRDVTTQHLAPPQGPLLTKMPTSLALLRGSVAAEPSIVLGDATGADHLMQGRRSSAVGPFVYTAPELLPGRGSRRTQALLVADLDLDGDPDLVTQRYDAPPALHLGMDLQVATVGVAQAGREGLLRIGVSDPRALHAVVIDFNFLRAPLPGLGIARLPYSSAMVPHIVGGSSRVQELQVKIPAGVKANTLWMQIIRASGNRLWLGNLESVQIVRD